MSQRRRSTPNIGANTTTGSGFSPYYPNPGYQGHSSHTTIFERLPSAPNGEQENFAPISTVRSIIKARSSLDEIELLRGRLLLEEIQDSVSVRSCAAFVEMWLARGSNLALAGPLMNGSARTTEAIFKNYDGAREVAGRLSEDLFRQSSSVLMLSSASTFVDFCAQFTFENARWETLGLFFTAVSTATIDIAWHSGLFTSQRQRQHLRKVALRFADQCLALSLTLDCLNDLQLILQYENFINHSLTHGDQSFGTWKRLGDIISSLYALGYHEPTRAGDNCPKFLRHIREAVFAFTYSADKNLSIFLGRPPRMQHKYCNFDFLWQSDERRQNSDTEQPLEYLGWKADGPFSYMAEAWWSVICALQKEELLQVFREKDQIERVRQASLIRAEARKSWLTLPSRLRLTGKLMSAECSPIERDFLANARLNHLHVLFLLELSLSSNHADPGTALLTVAAEILRLIIEENLIKEHLVNSGTGLIWRVAYYCLPAAGILCLALLNSAFHTERADLDKIRVLQDLGVLVAQVQTGGLIDSIDPNYALLFEATETIKTIVDKIFLHSLNGYSRNHALPIQSPSLTGRYDAELWAPWINNDTYDFEVPFWTNLAEHPSLLSFDNGSYDRAMLDAEAPAPVNT